ncbi:Gfo/Idh/MocA family oxidoreductase [Streptomyces sp. SID10853]|uniref:Gfo/Idh/MocA family protein n=1 Tax=Streptomyces sp. SID10853 TaxID=2706028 RepID=UPI0013C0D72A|nr:Gfo/Idh/MocA family oxidoreductase [Streptomyces sp. SID10853]NDZ81090.1 Gfo/Idh/MocA family oxidoreductase [Streptomyces sp. SID10853]
MTAPRIGLIGLGVISRFYLAALERDPDTELTAVCDPDAARLASAPPHARRYRDHRELLRDADVDAVVVNVPNDLHHSVCRDALTAGRAVCVEKPLATELSEAQHLVRLSRTHGVPLFTSFHRRYNAEVDALLERLPPGVPIASLTVRYDEMIEEHAGADRWYLDPDRCGGGCVADNGPNAFDLVRLFIGDTRVTAATVDRDARGTDRRASIRLAAATGAVARVELDWSYPGERKTVEVRLADGTVDSADMLAGHTAFKGSLWHEYVGVLRDFTAQLAQPSRRSRTSRPGDPVPGAHAPDGLAALELVAATYAQEHEGGPHQPGPREGAVRS